MRERTKTILSVACTTCNAEPTAKCTSMFGTEVSAHAARIRTSKVGMFEKGKCPCGGGDLHYLCNQPVHSSLVRRPVLRDV